MKVVRHEAPRDGTVKFLTGATIFILGSAAVLLVAGFGQDLYARFRHPAVFVVPLVFLVTPVIVLFAVSAEAPVAYTVGDDTLRIERRAGTVSIPISSIREVRVLPAQVTFWRVGGSGGWLGFYGEFKNPELGQVTMYATRTEDRVLVVTDGRSYVVTPASPEAFAADLESRLRSRGGQPPAATASFSIPTMRT